MRDWVAHPGEGDLGDVFSNVGCFAGGNWVIPIPNLDAHSIARAFVTLEPAKLLHIDRYLLILMLAPEPGFISILLPRGVGHAMV